MPTSALAVGARLALPCRMAVAEVKVALPPGLLALSEQEVAAAQAAARGDRQVAARPDLGAAGVGVVAAGDRDRIGINADLQNARATIGL